MFKGPRPGRGLTYLATVQDTLSPVTPWGSKIRWALRSRREIKYVRKEPFLHQKLVVGSTWPLKPRRRDLALRSRNEHLRSRNEHRRRMPVVTKICKGCGTNKASAWRTPGEAPRTARSALVQACRLHARRCISATAAARPEAAPYCWSRGAEGEGEEHQEEGSIADVIAPIYKIKRVLGQR